MLEKTKVCKWLMLIALIAVQGTSACSTLGKSRGDGEARHSNPATCYYEHTVRWPGETLASIAKWYTGDAQHWSILARENPNIHPATIKIGDNIRIPQNILTRSEPMPRSAIGAHTSKARRTQAPKGAPQGVRDTEDRLRETAEPGAVPEATPHAAAVELYGPKE